MKFAETQFSFGLVANFLIFTITKIISIDPAVLLYFTEGLYTCMCVHGYKSQIF